MPYPPATKNAPTPPFAYDGTEPCGTLGWDAYFGSNTSKLNAARQLCAGCPIFTACDEWAIEHEEFGFWAGRSADERERIRKAREIPLRRPEARGTRRPSTPKHNLAAA